MAWEFDRVAGPFGFTEGPVWDGEGVLFTDIPNDRVMRYVHETGSCEVYHENTGGANGLKLDEQGRLYACETVRRQVTRYENDERVVLAHRYRGDRLNSPNDIAIDGEGTVWFTDPHYASPWEPEGKELELDHRSVYRIEPGSSNPPVRATFDTTNPNGVLVSPDGERLYVAQTDYEGAHELRAYPIGTDGRLGEYDVLHNFSPHRGIDGMCLDSDGNIVAAAGWEESGPGPLLYLFEPTGRVIETHPSPDPFPANCCFGDSDLRTLYLTGSDGCLYRTRTERTGYLGPPESNVA